MAAMKPFRTLPPQAAMASLFGVTATLACNLLIGAPSPTPGTPGGSSIPLPNSPTVEESAALPSGPSASNPTSESPVQRDALADFASCAHANQSVAVIVPPALVGALEPRIRRFAHDLCADGYQALLVPERFETPLDLREALSNLRTQEAGRLEGALLVGEIPHAYQYVTMRFANPDLVPLEEEAISFQFYSDLDGVFFASPGYSSPGGRSHSFDGHSGDTDWELWIGVLPSIGGGLEPTIEALGRYLDKNHAYREGLVDIPRRFLHVSEHHSATSPEEQEQVLGWMRAGEYAWKPFSQAADSLFAFSTTAGGMTLEEGYSGLSAGRADFFVGDAHGFHGGHGQLSLAWLAENPLQTIFFWSNGCAVGDLDHDPNFLSAALYDAKSTVLIAKGTTNNSGGMGSNQDGFFGRNIATAMAAGMSFGEALLAHVNVPLLEPWAENREFHYATVLVLGDPTLRLRE